MQNDILLEVHPKSRFDLTNIFNKKIRVEVSPEAFVFSMGAKSISIKTYLLIRKKKDKYIVAGVGDGFERESGCERIELFKSSDSLPQNISLDDCLVSYIRYGFQEIHKGNFLFNPTVIFKKSHRIGHCLGGYHQIVLVSCTTMAGAYTVEFDE